MSEYTRESNIDDIFKFWIAIGVIFTGLFTYVYFSTNDYTIQLINVLMSIIVMIFWGLKFKKLYSVWKVRDRKQ